VGVVTGSLGGAPMNEIILGATLAGNMLMMMAFWLMIKEMRRDLISMSKKVDAGLDNIEVEIPELDTIKEEIFEMMGSMQQPNWLDHVGGAIGQMIQAKTMRAMQGSELIPEDMIHNDSPP